MEEQNSPKGASLAIRLLAPLTGLILFNSAHGIDQEAFDIVCESTGICDGTGNPILDDILGTTDFGASLSPAINGTLSALTISANTSIETIEDRLDVLRNGTTEISSLYWKDPTRSIEHLWNGGGASADDPFSNNWGFFGSVKYTKGERKNISLDTDNVNSGNFSAGGDVQLGFDYTSANVTAGFDYKLTQNLIIGISGAYTFSETESTSTLSRTEVDEALISIFGSVYKDTGFYADMVIGAGVGTNYYDRAFGFSTEVNGAPVEFSTIGAAESDTDIFNASFGMGFNNYIEAWTISPFFQINWLQNNISGYQESPTGIDTRFPDGPPTNISELFPLLSTVFAQEVARNFLLDVDEQNVRSLTAVLGSDFSRAFNMSWGVITPKLSVSWINQFEDQEDIVARFQGAGSTSGADFVTDVPELDSSFFNLGIGLTATHQNDIASFINVDTILANSDIAQTSVNLGLRIEF